MKNLKVNFQFQIIVTFFIAALIFVACRSQTEGEKETVHPDNDYISVFNGEDLTGWHVVLKNDAPADSTFRAEEGILYCTGEPFGYIRTDAKYSDYDFTVQWRWPEEPGNSGVFLHINEDEVFPKCLECQLMNGKAGDFVAFEGVEFNEYQDRSRMAIPKKEESSEKSAGEWNTYDIRVRSDSVVIYVNDVLQNVATGLNIDHGWIALQSEGAPIEFRDIRIKVLE